MRVLSGGSDRKPPSSLSVYARGSCGDRRLPSTREPGSSPVPCLRRSGPRSSRRSATSPGCSGLTRNTPRANRLWAYLIVEELLRCGVDFFCVAPGSRSTPLVAALAANERARSLIHFDERGTAFAALGYARATGHPAAWITTSGTAVANGLPAVVEAATDGVPMVLTTVDQAAYRANRTPQGPIHLNLMFREPLLPDPGEGPMLSGPSSWAQSDEPYTRYAATKPAVDEMEIHRLWEVLRPVKRGLVLAGRLASRKQGEAVLRLADTLGWPLLPDIGSQIRLGTEAL